MSEVDWIEMAFADRAVNALAILDWVDDEHIFWGFRREQLDPEAADDAPRVMYFGEEIEREGPGYVRARIQVDILVPQEPPTGGLEVLSEIDQAVLDTFYEQVWNHDGHRFDCWATDSVASRPTGTEPLRRTRNLLIDVTKGAG